MSARNLLAEACALPLTGISKLSRDDIACSVIQMINLRSTFAKVSNEFETRSTSGHGPLLSNRAVCSHGRYREKSGLHLLGMSLSIRGPQAVVARTAATPA